MREKEIKTKSIHYKIAQELLENTMLVSLNKYIRLYEEEYLKSYSERIKDFPEEIKRDFLKREELLLQEEIIKIEKDFQIFMDKSREILEEVGQNYRLEKVCQGLPNNRWAIVVKTFSGRESFKSSKYNNEEELRKKISQLAEKIKKGRECDA